MTDLEKLISVLNKEKTTPQSYWDILLHEQGDDKRAKRCFVIGCPNSNGAYLQCLFDRNESLLEAKIIESDGRICSCKWCVPQKKGKKRRR